MTLVITTPPATGTYPFTLADAKAHLRVTHSEDDSYIEDLIDVAVDRCEQFTGRQILEATWQLILDQFPDDQVIKIHKQPVSSITSISYVDEDGQNQTVSESLWEADLNRDPVTIRPVEGENWPDTNDQYAAVTIEFVAGYADAASIPKSLISAMKLILARLYSTRMDSSMKNSNIRASENLMRPYKINRDA